MHIKFKVFRLFIVFTLVLLVLAPHDIMKIFADEAIQEVGDTGAGIEEPDTSDLQSEIDKKREELKGLGSSLKTAKSKTTVAVTEYNSVKESYEGITGQLSTLHSQIETQKNEIENINISIEATGAVIEEKETEIKTKEEEYAIVFNEFTKRVEVMYQNARGSSVLDIVFGAKNFSGMLRSSSIMSQIAENDNAIMETLFIAKTGIEADKAALEVTKSQLETDKQATETAQAELEGKEQEQQALQDQLSVMKSEHADIVNQLENQEQALATEYRATEKEIAARESEVKSVYEAYYAAIAKAKAEGQSGADIGYTGTSNGAGYAWPSPGNTKISCAYMGYPGHSGMDITNHKPGAIYGTSVVAADEGQVIATINGTTGYGKYIIIDHGSGYSTLYAHLSGISVSKGQNVTKGQTIGQAGNTGRSSGPHLHFEVRINGQHVNPANYVR